MNDTLNRVFEDARRGRKALFFPYICLGYPSYSLSLACARSALRAGAAGLELGLPFSDPIADGPTLQMATQQALNRGTKPADVFKVIRTLRQEGFQQPLLVMSYANLLERMGWKYFASQLEKVGGSGAIVPDLPQEKFSTIGKPLFERNLSLIPFVAPTSDPNRIRKVDAMKAPFLYYVSVTGVTGARKTLPVGLLNDLRKIKRKIRTPLVVGFGISTPLQAAQIGKTADGVIIASALIKLISKMPSGRVSFGVERFCRDVLRKMS